MYIAPANISVIMADVIRTYFCSGVFLNRRAFLYVSSKGSRCCISYRSKMTKNNFNNVTERDYRR